MQALLLKIVSAAPIILIWGFMALIAGEKIITAIERWRDNRP